MANLATIQNNILADSGIDPIDLIVGTGTVNYIPKFTAEGAIGDSIMSQSGSNILISGNIALHAGNYNNYAPTLTGGGATGTWGINITGKSEQVTINYGNDSNANYYMLFGSGNSIYATGLIYLNAFTDTIYAAAYRGSANVDGTGEATYHPAGIYSGGTEWFYGTMYRNGSATYHANGSLYQVGLLELNNGFQISQVSGNNYGQFNNWVFLPGNHGFYSGVNNAHLLPNDGTYGPWRIIGTRGGYNGIEFDASNGRIVLMVDPTSNGTGFHNNNYGWQFLWSNGSLYVYKNTYGGGTNAVVLDSVNYNSYAPTLTGGGASGLWGINITGNADTVDGYHASAFALVNGNTGQSFGVFELTYAQTQFNPSQAPRTGLNAMSIKMWDNYFAGIGLGVDYGTVMEYYGRGGHADTQVYFDAGGGSWYRTASYASGWQSWQKYVTENSGTWSINISGASATTPLLTSSGSLLTQFGSGTIGYTYAITAGTSGLFPASDNSNATITINRHPGDYYSQLGFSSNGQLYYRAFAATPINTSQGWVTLLTSSNYNSYAPTLTGGGASGTWGISITGNADTVDGYHESAFMRYYGYSTSGNFQTFQAVPGRLRFDQVGEINSGSWSNAPTGIYTYGGVLSYRGDHFGLQIYASHTGGMVYKTQWNDDQYSGWLRIFDTQNYNNYVPTLTGGGASGTWAINVTGNAQYLANNVSNPADANNIWRAGVYTYFNGTNVPGGDFGFISIPTWTSTEPNSRYNLQIGSNIGGDVRYRATNISGAGTWNTLLSNINYSSYAVQTTGQSNWNSYSVIGNVVGLLAWKNYGNSHVIFDASQGTSPSGTSVSQTNSDAAWAVAYPTLMGWNGTNTYGVRVDSARVADSAGSVDFNNLTNKTGGTGTYQTSGDFRAPIFYDSQDTNYYVDPNSTSRLYYLNVPQGIVSIGNPWGTANSAFFPNGITTAGADNWIYGHTYIGNAPANGAGHEFWSDGNMRSTGYHKASIYYDDANTAYYLDPNSFSNLYSATFNSTVNFSSTTIWFGGYGPGSGPGMQFENVGSFLRMAFWGLDFYDWDYGIQMTLNNNYVSVNNYLQAGNSLRAPIFYDSNDTGYYLDPNGGSNLYSVVTVETKARKNQSDNNYTTAALWTESYGNTTTGIAFHISGVVGKFLEMRTNGILYWANDQIVTNNGGTWNINISGSSSSSQSSNVAYNLQAADATLIRFNNVTNTDYSTMTFMSRAWQSVQGANGLAYRFDTHTNGGAGGYGALQIFYGESGYVFAPTSFRAPIFYDSQDTSYYIDPNAGSRLSTLTTEGRIYSNEWIQFSNGTGLYSPINGAHFRPNQGSYGAWLVTGSRNGWSGIEFESLSNGNVSLMINTSSNISGWHNNSYGWQFKWEGGTAYVYKNAYGGGTQATVWDSVNAPRAANNSLMYYQGFTLDANTMDTNSTGFTYAQNAPYVGPVARFSTGGGYDLWFNAPYSGGGESIAFRTRNGDSATLNAWRYILTDANYTNYAVPTSGYTFGSTFVMGTMFVSTGEQYTPSYLLGVFSNGYAYKFPLAGIQSWLGLGNYLPLSGGTMTGKIYTASFGSDTYGGAMEIRERGYVGVSQSDWSYSPAITFHWGGRFSVRLGFDSSGYLAVDNVRFLNANNYNSYSPTLTGGGASGTWGININGSSNSSNYSSYLTSNTASVSNGFVSWNSYDDTTNNPGTSWWYGMRVSHGDAISYYSFSISSSFFSNGQVYYRRIQGGTSQNWVKFMDEVNSPYAYSMNQYVRTTDAPTFFGTLSLSADNSVNYTGSRIWLYSHSSYRGSGVYMSLNGGSSTWYAGTPYTDFSGYYMIGHVSATGNDSAADPANRKWSVSPSGNTYQIGSATATSFFESSDMRIKELIQDNYTPDGIESITARLYSKNGKIEVGYYAQDVQGILASAVSVSENGHLNLSYREVHTAKIAYLENKIKQLEEKLNALY